MDTDFTPVVWNGAGHIVDFAFSETLQVVFLGISDGSIHFVDPVYATLGLASRPASHCATHHGGGLEHLRMIPGNPERLLSIASDGSVMIWRLAYEGLQPIRTLYGFHSLTPPHVVACRRASSVTSATSTGDSSVFLVFATDDGALNWWDLENFSSNATLLDGIGLITALDIDVVEDLVAVGTASGDVRVWRMSTLGYVFQTVVPGVVTKLVFLPDGTGDNRVIPGRRLALLTNESSLQIHTFKNVTGGRELLPPMTISDYRDAGVFDIHPVNENTLLVVQRDGTWRALDCGISAGPQLSLAGQPLWVGPLNGLQLRRSVNASLLLVKEGVGVTAVIPLLSCPSSSVYNPCWVGAPKSLSANPAWSLDIGWRPLRNARPMANHIVHSPPLNVFARYQGEVLERPFDACAFKSNHDTSHGQNGDHDSDLDIPESSSDTPAEDSDDDSRHDRHMMTLGHPPSNVLTGLHEARQKHGPTIQETVSDSTNGDCGLLCNPPAERTAAPHRDVETLKRHAKFLASLISGRVWNHDHFERVAQALRDNEQRREGSAWPFGDETRRHSDEQIRKELIAAERRLTKDRNERRQLGGLGLDELLNRIEERHKRIATKIGKNAEVEKQADTIVVGISPDGKDIYIAGNVKNCETKVLRKGMGEQPPEHTDQRQPGEQQVGLHNSKYDEAIWGLLRNWYPEATSPGVQVHIVHPKTLPGTVDEMRSFHGETQIIAFAKENNLPMPILGVSKPPCASCERALTENGVQHDHNAIKEPNNNPERWNKDYLTTEVTATPLARPQQPSHHHEEEHHGTPPTAAEQTAPRISRKSQAHGAAKTVLGAVRKAYTTPRVTRPEITTPKATAKALVKATVHPTSKRPRIAGGIGAMVESVVDNWDRPAFTDGTPTEYVDAGVYHTRMTDGVYAQAGMGLARAGCSVAEAEARGPNVSAGAQWGKLSGVSMFAHAELASAQASVAGVTAKVGLNANTGFSAGVDGVSAEFLGFGVAVGPHIEVDTPVASLSCVVM
ncbi:hypothetical protein QBC43DRAFT_271434 [Cladorrhinum sp. PSN259]|nr:hypothetical protein QBC43DRAFT_271434 [Cladorrhinum sp. PSN259]